MYYFLNVFSSSSHGWIPSKATVSQPFSTESNELCIKRQQMQNVRQRRLKSDRYHGREVGREGVGGVFNTGTAECEPSRVSDLSVHISCTNSVWSARSDPRKRSETLVSMNPLPPTTTSTATTYLWWCISGISCSLSEWADWIDVFSLHDPFHTRRTNLCSLRGPFISL